VGATEADAARNLAMGAGLVDDPYPLFHELIARCPVEYGSLLQHFPNPASRQFEGVVADRTITAHAYEAGVDALRQSEALSSEKFYGPALNAAIGQSVIGMDEPEHRRMRLLLQTAFSKAKMERWKGSIIQPVVDEHLLRIRPLGRADLYAEVAVNVPVQTIGVALGLLPEDRRQFFDWAVGMTSGAEISARRRARIVAAAAVRGPPGTARQGGTGHRAGRVGDARRDGRDAVGRGQSADRFWGNHRRQRERPPSVLSR
jgi:cytochrome P450